MGWQDRDYASEAGYGGSRRYYRGANTHVFDVTTLIIIANVLVFFFIPTGSPTYLAYVMQAEAVWHGQIWRLFTATYLHFNGVHIFFNMLMLYFFGGMLEQRWGRRQFFIVYTIGGVLGNILLALLGRVGFIGWQTFGIGASGSVWTIMAAAAVYFPNTELLIYFLVPVKLRTAVAVYGVWYVWNVFKQGPNYGGDLCHLAGLAFGLYWAWTGGWAWVRGDHPRVVARGGGGGGWRGLFGGLSRTKDPSLKERIAQRREDSATVDAILAKVYDKGIHSLTPAERKALTEATERLRQEERRGDQVGRT